MGEEIKLGSKVKDSITGFEGVATGRATYISGVPRVSVEALQDGKPVQEWFDEARLVVVLAPA